MRQCLDETQTLQGLVRMAQRSHAIEDEPVICSAISFIAAMVYERETRQYARTRSGWKVKTMDKKTLTEVHEILRKQWIKEQKETDALITSGAPLPIASYNCGHGDGIGRAMMLLETLRDQA